jgi:hypothetical protein
MNHLLGWRLRDIYTRYLNWRLVRSIAELQVFTRVSYAMLVVVPTLAGTWPAVRSVVNRFDTAAASLSSGVNQRDESDLLSSSPPRKRGPRACPWLEQGASGAVSIAPGCPLSRA